MTKDQARRYIESRGFRVVLMMGSYPSPSYYAAFPSGPWGQVIRGSLNGIAAVVKRKYQDEV